MKCHILFSEKNKKNISKCRLLKILPRVLSVKKLSRNHHQSLLFNKFPDVLYFFVSVAFKEKQADDPPKAEKAPAAADKGKGAKGGKGGKDKTGKDKDGKGSRPPSQQFDLTKPHWTLRIVSDASCAVSTW